MKMYVGVTDRKWFEFLKSQQCDEVNFWSPGSRIFKAIPENNLFLFKLHAPENYIVGGGFFVRYSKLPTFLAWDAFGIKNGTESKNELEKSIQKYRTRNGMDKANPEIGCIILTEPFFFDRENWIPVPDDWSKSIVTGKTYDTITETGNRLYKDVLERIQLSDKNRYSESLVKHRLGQGAFRVGVVDAYGGRCAVTGEKTLPVLEAAHIKPYAKEGPHEIDNGILLRSDLHILFDDGYITVDDDYRINISHRLHEDYGNGKRYYDYQGEQLLVLPEQKIYQPNKDFLEWHNNNVYLG